MERVPYLYITSIRTKFQYIFIKNFNIVIIKQHYCRLCFYIKQFIISTVHKIMELFHMLSCGNSMNVL